MRLRTPIMGLAVIAAACSTPGAEPAAEPAMAAPDTAAIRAELRAASDRYQTAYVAGDVAAIAATFTEDAVAEYQGFPTAVGRAAIESTYTAYFASNKFTVAEINLENVSGTGPDAATGLGTFHSFGESAGKPIHQWWRYVAAYTKGADGQWKTAYIMAFPDSTK